MPNFSKEFKPKEIIYPDKENRMEHRWLGSAPTMLELRHITKISVDDVRSLREWWHTILRNRDKYPCYAIFLVLPSDQEANKYLTDFGKELAVVTGKDCLVIVLGSDSFFTIGNVNQREYDDFYVRAIEKHISEGESVKVAELFGVGLVEFPCVIFFQDIRKSKHILMPLKNLTSSEIALEFRGLFSEIHNEVEKSKDTSQLLSVIEWYLIRKDISQKKKEVSYKLMDFVDATIKSVIDSWVKNSM